MPTLSFAEVFGYPVDATSEEAQSTRRSKSCPFKGGRCTKVSKDDPRGICSLEDDNRLVTLCPTRFAENHRMFRDAAKLAFPSAKKLLVTPEIQILRKKGDMKTRIGKVDYLIGHLNRQGECVDFAAVEVQSVYVSGKSVKEAFDEYLRSGDLSRDARSRPDFRSSAQKRLMPQLELKVEVFRRWGKKFFVAVDSAFFESLPLFDHEELFENSEITWMVYPFNRSSEGFFRMGSPTVIFSHWEAVKSALREGIAPSQDEILRAMEKNEKSFRLDV